MPASCACRAERKCYCGLGRRPPCGTAREPRAGSRGPHKKTISEREWMMNMATKLAWGGVVVVMLAVASPAPAQEIKLTLADQNSPTGWGPAHALYPWVKQVEEATKGRVKLEVFPSQTLIKGIDMWKGIRTGIADIGWCVHGYWPEQTPLSDVMSLPFLPLTSAEKGSEVLWKLYEKFLSIQKEYGEIQPIVLHTTSPNFLLSNKKQVKTLEDFKGLKVRVLGG